MCRHIQYVKSAELYCTRTSGWNLDFNVFFAVHYFVLCTVCGSLELGHFTVHKWLCLLALKVWTKIQFWIIKSQSPTLNEDQMIESLYKTVLIIIKEYRLAWAPYRPGNLGSPQQFISIRGRPWLGPTAWWQAIYTAYTVKFPSFEPNYQGILSVP